MRLTLPRLTALLTLLLPGTEVCAHALEDFGDGNAKRVLSVLQPGNGKNAYLHLVQIGDSHTAGDYFTDRLRVRLQAQIGNGGIGWAMPMYVPGQRLARIGYDNVQFQLLSSRDGGQADYPFGGLIAMGNGVPATLTIKPKLGDAALQHVTMLLNQGPMDPPLQVTDSDGRQFVLNSDIVDSFWSSTSFDAKLPYTIHIQGSPETRIGGWWLRSQGPGAIVSAVGINGAELAQWSRWREDWIQDLKLGKPNIVAIAYGTNEAFRTPLTSEQLSSSLESAVDRIREQMPEVAILIIGAPESLESTRGNCGSRAPSLNLVQQVQRTVARQRHTLYWDWQAAMGGACTMKSWIARGLARKDGVHFSKEGYELAADDLFQGLMTLPAAVN